MKTREELIARQQELLDAARAAGREMTAEEQNEWNDCQRQIEALDAAARQAEVQRQSEQAGCTGATQRTEAEFEAVRQAERNRIREIENICRSFNMDASSYVASGMSVDNVKSAVLNQLMANGTPVAARGTADVEVTESAEDKFRRAAADALVMRAGINIEHPAEGAKELRHLSLKDLFIESNPNESGLNRKSASELFIMAERQFFNPTAAFPAILDNAINKSFVEGHKKVAVTFDRFTRKGTLTDFKINQNNYVAGPTGEFLLVPEGGELKADKPTDAKKPTRQLKTYGRQFTLTRQAFINDDIGLITTLPARYAESARRTINKQVYEVLVNNPVIYDGKTLFHNDHKNALPSGTGITQASFQKMIMALQTQKDEFDQAIIVRPKYVIAPIGLAFDMFTILHSATINTSGNTQAVNPLFNYASQLEIVEDPTINALCGGFGNAMPWFLAGSQDDTEFIQVDYLDGNEIPTMRRMEVSGQLGFVWDIYLDWGIAVMDYRGAIKNPGTTVSNPLS